MIGPSNMTTHDLVEKILRLPERQQRIVSALVEELVSTASSTQATAPGHWFGCLEHLGIQISAEEMDQARRESWGPTAACVAR